MIRIHKRPLPDGVKITCEKDYQGGAVKKMLREDCHDKCYICEDKTYKDSEVEHRISRKGDVSLKYNWNNLFLVCRYCNKTKSNQYDGIIDPIKVDPEKYIELSLDVDDDLKEIVVVLKMDGCRDVDVTVDLLKAVYNGAKTADQRVASQYLRDKISKALSLFYQELDEYKATPSVGSVALIKEELSDRSPFSAFKRKIIRSDPELSKKFSSMQI